MALRGPAITSIDHALVTAVPTRMTPSATDQIRSWLSDCARAGLHRRKTSLFNLISLIKRAKAYLVQEKAYCAHSSPHLGRPTRSENSNPTPPVPKKEASANRTGCQAQATPEIPLQGLKQSAYLFWLTVSGCMDRDPISGYSFGQELELCWIGRNDGFFDTPLRLSCDGHESGNFLWEFTDQRNKVYSKSPTKMGEATGTRGREAEPGRLVDLASHKLAANERVMGFVR